MTEPRFMSCRELIDFLWAYLSGEVSEEERRQFEYHLALCPSCVAYLNTYRETIALSRAAYDEVEAVEEMPEELIQAVLASRHTGG